MAEEDNSQTVQHSGAVDIAKKDKSTLGRELLENILKRHQNDSEDSEEDDSFSQNPDNMEKNSRLEKILSHSPQFRLGGSFEENSPPVTGKMDMNYEGLSPDSGDLVKNLSSCSLNDEVGDILDHSTIPRTLRQSRSDLIFNESVVELDFKNESKVGRNA